MSTLSRNRLSPRLLETEYAVRGPIVQRAAELAEQGRRVVYCNIGNPQALEQRPLSYLRQILSLVEYPELLSAPQARALFPSDILQRARDILTWHPHGTGAYTDSAGISFIRQAVADFITRRDGIPADRDHILLTDGASKAAQSVLTGLLRTPQDGVLIPIPQYPLYSATLTLLGGRQAGYFLDEQNQWHLTERVLTQAWDEAQRKGTNPVAVVVINPGNPTGAVLAEEDIAMVIGFARRHGIAILADEVYQENVYRDGRAFHSFARVMHALGEQDVPLFSFHSVSKGFLGECGHRGGYVEFRNIPDEVMAEFVKLQTVSLCANVDGQLATYLMVAPPQPGDESHAVYVAERDAILRDLKRKAQVLGEGINRIPGMSVIIPEGAMYAFVRFTLPPDDAVRRGSTPEEQKAREAQRDTAYCLALLEETGICVVPGSGFGQEPGTFHFRTTFLPPAGDIAALVEQLRQFHLRYTKDLVEA